VNKTNSAIRVVHLPTGLAVAVQSERCAVANKKRALRILQARLQEAQRTRLAALVSADRRRQVGGAERSEKIRTYNWPQARVTDHRTGHTLNNPDSLLCEPSKYLGRIAAELRLRERHEYLKTLF
jgi:peptide chain release factor 1